MSKVLQETSYGIARRLGFVEQSLRSLASRSDSAITVADIGAGTGEFLTIPLAQHMGTQAVIYAFEPEMRSYQHLQKRIEDAGYGNLHALQTEQGLQARLYDAIIVSEVLEHVAEPIAFLRQLARLLRDPGVIIITVPNGYGLFELETLLFNVLDLIGLIPLLRRLKRALAGSAVAPASGNSADTLAISPHINFFTLNDLRRVLCEAGLLVVRIEGKHMAAGPFSDRIIDKNATLLRLNVDLGKVLPLPLVAGWMLVSAKDVSGNCRNVLTKPRSPGLLRRKYSSYKRSLNERLARRQQQVQHHGNGSS